MPKTTLTFSLPEEAELLHLALNGAGYHAALWDLDQYLRSRLKYELLPADVADALQAVRDQLYACMQAEDVSFTV